MFGQYRVPHLQIPYLVVASQNDKYQLGNDVNVVPTTPAEIDYVLDFANRTRELVFSLHTADPRRHAIFSWSCHNHAVSESQTGFNDLTSGSSPDVTSTMNDALVQFLGLYGEHTERLEWVDRCNGIACGSGCNASSYP